jgi:holo-[acyl-carrier protein] synthase
MMIIGIGTDLVEILRIETLLNQKGERFLNRIFTPSEQERALKSAHPASSLAKRFAAKEAVVKALGTGFRDGISLHDIEVANEPHGKPMLILTGKARETLDALTPSHHISSLHLSLSDTASHALAFVLIEGVLF